LADVVITLGTGNVKRYPLPDEFTYGEMRTLKAVTGMLPIQFDDALTGGDAETVMALAIISANRVGDELDMDTLDALPYGAVMIVEGEGDRPTEAAADSGGAENPTTPEPGGDQS